MNVFETPDVEIIQLSQINPITGSREDELPWDDGDPGNTTNITNVFRITGV